MLCPICHRFQCASGCPNASEPKAPHVCFQCETPIYRGDTAFGFGEKIFCQDCITDAAFVVTEVGA